jgi:hypothetical protein
MPRLVSKMSDSGSAGAWWYRAAPARCCGSVPPKSSPD